MKPIFCLYAIPILLVLLIATLHVLPASAQDEGSAVQQIQQNGIAMQFSYYPSSPVINDYTNFTFNVLNTTTGKPLQNFVASVTVSNVVNFTGGSGYYNFSSINVPNGTFSVSYAFPNDGLFPVFLRVNYPTANYGPNSPIAIGEFKVFVPVQNPVPTNDNTFIYVGIAIAAAGAGAGIVLMQKRKPKNV
jgi:hypothetical protein